MKIRKLHIDHFKIFQNFDLDLTHHDQAQPLIVIAGINGSGKTTLLKEVIYNLSPNNPVYKVNKRNTVLVKDGSIEIEYNEQGKIKTRLINANNMFFSEAVIFYQPGFFDKKSFKRIIVEFIDHFIYEKDKKSSEAYRITQELLISIFQNFDLQIEFQGLDQQRNVLFRNALSEKIKIEDLSSGEQELISRVFCLYLANIQDSVILIDEPESSLHPNWQNRIAAIYQDFAEKNNNQIILATHSPHIVASVRKEQIRVLVKENNTVRAIENFTGSYGWRVDKVLLEIFRVSGLRTTFIEEKLAQLRQRIFTDQYDSDEFKNAQTELEKILGYDDIDMALIRMEIAKRKKGNHAAHR